MVECSPATRAARVRFPDDAEHYFSLFQLNAFVLLPFKLVQEKLDNKTFFFRDKKGLVINQRFAELVQFPMSKLSDFFTQSRYFFSQTTHYWSFFWIQYSQYYILYKNTFFVKTFVCRKQNLMTTNDCSSLKAFLSFCIPETVTSFQDCLIKFSISATDKCLTFSYHINLCNQTNQKLKPISSILPKNTKYLFL